MLSVRRNFRRTVFTPVNAVVFDLVKNKAGEVVNTVVSERKVSTVSENFGGEVYKILNCNLIDMVDIEIEDKVYTVICDEEFLLKPHSIATLFIGNLAENQFTVICNSFMIVRFEVEKSGVEEIQNLTKEEIKDIIKYIDKSQLKLMIAFAKGLIK